MLENQFLLANFSLSRFLCAYKFAITDHFRNPLSILCLDEHMENITQLITPFHIHLIKQLPSVMLYANSSNELSFSSTADVWKLHIKKWLKALHSRHQMFPTAFEVLRLLLPATVNVSLRKIYINLLDERRSNLVQSKLRDVYMNHDLVTRLTQAMSVLGGSELLPPLVPLRDQMQIALAELNNSNQQANQMLRSRRPTINTAGSNRRRQEALLSCGVTSSAKPKQAYHTMLNALFELIKPINR